MKANIVVIGAGIVGTSIAYHLTQRGVQNVVLIDKGDLDENDGSTSHAPGGLRTLTVSDFFTRLGYASREVYDKLPLAVEGEEQFFRTGFVQIAETQERFNSYKRIQEMGLIHGIESHLLTPQEVADKLPMMDPNMTVGGLFVPSSGVVKTSRIATSMRRIAEATGNLTSIADSPVTEVIVKDGRVTGIRTSNPEYPQIDCESVVLASNIWAPILCKQIGVPMPLFPGEHQYIFTDPTDALDPYKHIEHDIPICTLDDISLYFRQHDDRIGIGSYNHKARLVDPDKLNKTAKNPFTAEDFEYGWGLMQERLPVLKKTKVSHGFNGMFSFTVDHYPIMGESHVKGFWTAVGSWLSFASEVGKVMTNWMIDGDPGMDVRYADIHRFYPHQSNEEFLRRQAKYYYEIGFDILHPNEVASNARNIRFAPYSSRQESLGGVMVPFAGQETPWYYEANAERAAAVADRFPHRSGYDATAWSPIVGAEHLAMRESVGLMDWSAAITAVEVSGTGAVDYLNYLCSNECDIEVGKIAYTMILTPSGKIWRDVTVLRRSADTFWVLTGKANIYAELFYMQKYLPADGSVQLRDLGEGMTGLALWGPNARKVLEKVTHADVSNEAFPYYTAQDIGVGMAPATVVRISYAGALGYEIYAPVSFGIHLWDTLMEAGAEHDIVPVGVAALLSTRMETGYRLFGADLKPDVDPFEAGVGWSVKLDKADFVGKAAAMEAKANRKKKMVCLTFDNPDAIMYGAEPVYAGDTVIGKVTSGDYGYAAGKFIAYALIDKEHAKLGNKLRIRYTGNFYEGTVTKEPVLSVPEIRN